eukprot:scaffold52590_cov58-Phaeocystis_antarctica.AAC.2
MPMAETQSGSSATETWLGLGVRGFECDGDRHERGAEVLGGDPDQLEVSDRTWVWQGVESATSAGPHGRTAASHWTLSGSAARPECVAQPGACPSQPRRPGVASCGAAKAAL